MRWHGLSPGQGNKYFLTQSRPQHAKTAPEDTVDATLAPLYCCVGSCSGIASEIQYVKGSYNRDVQYSLQYVYLETSRTLFIVVY